MVCLLAPQPVRPKLEKQTERDKPKEDGKSKCDDSSTPPQRGGVTDLVFAATSFQQCPPDADDKCPHRLQDGFGWVANKSCLPELGFEVPPDAPPIHTTGCLCLIDQAARQLQFIRVLPTQLAHVRDIRIVERTVGLASPLEQQADIIRSEFADLCDGKNIKERRCI